MSYRWYIWIPARCERENGNDPRDTYGRRYSLPGVRRRAPNILERFNVWGLFSTKYGRLCWEQSQ